MRILFIKSSRNTYAIAANAKNGPKGIFTDLSDLVIRIYKRPKMEPIVEAINSVTKLPRMPMKDPMKANSSKSPSPIPSLPDSNWNNFAVP